MYLIAGLGNPGRKYAKTRYNMGFDALDLLAQKCGARITTRKFKAKYGFATIGSERVLLVKPQTFMNGSGEAIRDLCKYYHIDVEKELIVLVDDIALPPGKIRIRKQGSDGGQKGMQSIIAALKTNHFIRVRIGIGEKPADWDLADWVLSRFPNAERPVIDAALKAAADAAESIVKDGADIAMNQYNATHEDLS